MKSTITTICLCLLSLISLVSACYASNSIPESANQSLASGYRTMAVYCPPIKIIKKDTDPNKMTWYASGGWKSYTISFVNKIGKFIGARWIGANIGKLACYYKGEQGAAFPVILIYHTMALTPTKGHWRKLGGGNYICSSHKQKQCPFLVRLRPKKENLYKEVEQLKNNPND